MATILALGEVLWDVFPDGPRFGGALTNFACAAAGLGRHRARVFLASAVGNDDLGNDARRRLVEHGVDVSHLGTVDQATGQVFVELDAEGRGSYRFLDDPAWDHTPITPELLYTAATADVICFGTLGQKAPTSRNTIRAAVRAAKPDALRLLDINLRPPYWSPEVIRDSLALANVLKLNDEELPTVAEVLGIDGSADDFLRTVLSRYSLRLVALTRGANGAVLLAADGMRSEQPGVPVTIADTVGAGDTFTAALALGLVHNLPLDRINRWAVAAAAFVCTQPGGTPTFPSLLHLAP